MCGEGQGGVGVWVGYGSDKGCDATGCHYSETYPSGLFSRVCTGAPRVTRSRNEEPTTVRQYEGMKLISNIRRTQIDNAVIAFQPSRSQWILSHTVQQN